MFVPQSECKDAAQELCKTAVKPLKGTMQIHAVVSMENNVIADRETSCYCHNCFKDGTFHVSCERWSKSVLVQNKVANRGTFVEHEIEVGVEKERGQESQEEDLRQESRSSEEGEANTADQAYQGMLIIAMLLPYTTNSGICVRFWTLTLVTKNTLYCSGLRQKNPSSGRICQIQSG